MDMFFIFLPMMSAVLCLSTGLFALSRNPRHAANIGFLLGMTSLAVIEIGHFGVLYGVELYGLSEAGIKISLSGQALLAPCWLIFTVTFTRSEQKQILIKKTPLLIACFLLSFFFIFHLDSQKFFSVFQENTKIIVLNQILKKGQDIFSIKTVGRFFYSSLILGLVMNLVCLESIFRSSSRSIRWKVKYVLFGLTGIFGYFIYFSTRVLLFSSINPNSFPIVSMVNILCCLLILFFIVRHRLLDVDIFISRFVVYNSFTIMAVGLYLLFIGFVTEGLMVLGLPYSDFFSTFFVVASMLVLFFLLFASSLRRKVQLFINRNFYKHKYEFRDKWMEAIEKINSNETEEETCHVLTKIISETIPSKGVWLWMYHPISKKYCIVGENLVPDLFVSLTAEHPFVEYINKVRYPFNLSATPSDDEGGVNFQIMDETETVLCAPLVSGSHISGFILLGEDLAKEPYGTDDFELLNAITTQAAAQIINIRLRNDLLLAKEVEAFHRLSSFIVHDLKNLTNSLSLISQNAKHNMDNPEFQKDALKTINHTVSRMKGLIGKFASMPKESDVHKSTINLYSVINTVLKRIHLSDSKCITVLNKTEELPPLFVDQEALESVFTNMLTNSADSISEKGSISIDGKNGGDHVTITVSDSGSGMSEEFVEKYLFQPFKSTKKGGFGIGLFQCKTIIEAHGGSIEVKTKKGEGTQFFIYLPVCCNSPN